MIVMTVICRWSLISEMECGSFPIRVLHATWLSAVAVGQIGNAMEAGLHPYGAPRVQHELVDEHVHRGVR